MVAGAQSLLHLALARGVDALANDADLAGLERHQALRPADGKAVPHAPRRRAAGGKKRALSRDVLRRGAAAAAHDGDARVKHAGNCSGVLLGSHVIDGDATLHARQAGVCLRHHRAARPGEHPLHERRHVGRPERAVDAHGCRAERGERERRHLGRGAEEGPAVLLEGHRDEGGQARVLAHGQQRRLCLGEVCHGLDHEEVGTGGLGRADLPGKEIVGVLKGERAHRREQLAGRTDVGGNVARPRGPGAGDRGAEDLLHRGRVAQLVRVGPEGVGCHHVRAGGHVRRVDLGDLVGVSEAQQLRQLPGGEPARLKLRSHGTVKEQKLVPAQRGGKGAAGRAAGAVGRVGDAGIKHGASHQHLF